MYLTKAEVFSLPADAFTSVFTLCNAISSRFGCGVSSETAARIIADYRAGCTA